jgi:2-polyprenyl-3-methyl-5-hydroxy-6-metoxy-1,4-benzoquinol methylase
MPDCLVCKHDIELFGPRQGYEYHLCRACGTIQLWPMPSQAAVEEAYRSTYVAGKLNENTAFSPEWWREASRPYVQALVGVLKDYRVQGRVLDYGAGWGHLVDGMIKAGFHAQGLELSAKEVAYGRARGLPMRQEHLTEVQGLDGTLSAITMSAVLEHFVDHPAMLRAVHRLLKSDGLFVTMHPTAALFRMLGTIFRFGVRRRELAEYAGTFTPPWHTVLFSVNGTDQLISRHGFRLLEIRPAPQGRLGGVLGLIQVSLEWVNKFGWALLGKRWPLVTTHIFVFQKVG